MDRFTYQCTKGMSTALKLLSMDNIEELDEGTRFNFLKKSE
jgi:hypothetical protein